MYKQKNYTITITDTLTTIVYNDGSRLLIARDEHTILGTEFAEARYRRFGIMAANVLTS